MTLLNFNNCHTFTGKMYLFSCLRSDLVTPGDSTVYWADNAAQVTLWNVIPSNSESNTTNWKILNYICSIIMEFIILILQVSQLELSCIRKVVLRSLQSNTWLIRKKQSRNIIHLLFLFTKPRKLTVWCGKMMQQKIKKPLLSGDQSTFLIVGS